MVKATKKATMMKDVVGKVRTSTWDLPPASHTYGALVTKDSEGAGAVISTWDVSKPSVAKTSDRNLIKTNVLAIHHGNITSKDARLFAQAHPEIRFSPPGSNVLEGGVRKRDKIPFDGPYGTKSEKMACPLSALIEARFTDFASEGKDYPDVSVLQKKFFVMKKFQNTPGRVNPPNPGRLPRRTARAKC